MVQVLYVVRSYTPGILMVLSAGVPATLVIIGYSVILPVISIFMAYRWCWLFLVLYRGYWWRLVVSGDSGCAC